MTTPLQWVAVDLLTGQTIVDLPDFELTSELAVTIGAYESATGSLTITDKTNPSWEAATTPGACALIAFTGAPESPVVVWGGIILQRLRPPNSNVATFAMTTPEIYLETCPVGDYSATDVNQDTILADLVGFATSTNRMPITLRHIGASTQHQTASYASSAQVKVLSALQALSAVTNGPEWVMGWEWDVPAATISPVIYYGPRIGAAVMPGQSPAVTVETEDLLEGSVFTEDYTPGQGANQVIAYGAASTTAASDDVPVASATAIDLKGRPLWSFSYSPNQTVTDPVVLGTFAAAAVSSMNDGSKPLTMVLPVDAPGKRLGVDWNVGDDIGWSLAGKSFPSPQSGIARCIGYRMTPQTVTPILKGVSL